MRDKRKKGKGEKRRKKERIENRNVTFSWRQTCVWKKGRERDTKSVWNLIDR